MAARTRSAKMGLEVYASDRTKAGFASVQRGTQNLVTGVGKSAQSGIAALSGAVMGNAAFAGAAAGAMMIGFAADSVGAFIQVEKQWAEVTTLLPKHTKQATDQMLGQVRAFSRETGFIIADSIQASYQAISAGIADDALPDFLRTAAKAARAGVTDITTSVDAITSSLNAYGESANRATDYSDAMFTAIRLGKTTFAELAPVMGPVLPIAASLNTEFAEITAATASLTAQGNPTTIALTQIRSALVALSKDTEARTIFQSLTGQTYAEYQAGGGTLVGALTMIVDEANRTGRSIIDIFGRVEAANAALALTSQKGAATFTSAMTDMIGATETAFQKLETTTAVKAEKIKGVWNDIKLSVGSALTDIGYAVAVTVGVLEDASSDAQTAISRTADAATRDWQQAYATINGITTRISGTTLEDVAPDISLGGDQTPTATLQDYRDATGQRTPTGMEWAFFAGRTPLGDDYSPQARRERFMEWYYSRHPELTTTTAGTGFGSAADLAAAARRSRGGQAAAGADAALLAGVASGAITALTPSIASDLVDELQTTNPELFTSQELLRAGGAGTEADAMMNLRLDRYKTILDEFRASLESASDAGTKATEDNTDAVQQLTETLETERLVETGYDPDAPAARLLTSSTLRYFTRINAAQYGRPLRARIR